jgi:hypothetical protein
VEYGGLLELSSMGMSFESRIARELMTSLALGIKMNILLFLPGLWVVLFQIRGLGGMLESTAVIASIQVSLYLPFCR